jgi:hypothetical protein
MKFQPPTRLKLQIIVEKQCVRGLRAMENLSFYNTMAEALPGCKAVNAGQSATIKISGENYA